MIISLIAVLTTNHVIGNSKSNTIPWNKIPIDMLWFKYHTIKKPVIMGRKTFESIGRKPLLNRLNIILSRRFSKRYCNYNSCYTVENLEKVLFLVKNFHEVMVIGGQSVYEIFLPLSHRLYLTYIHAVSVVGDIYFPDFNIDKEWKLVFDECCKADVNHFYNLNFQIFERL